MALDERIAQHDKIPGDKYVNPIANYTMRTWDYVVRPSATPATGAIRITLPRVAEARGRFYSIIARQADAVHTITVQDQDDSECWLADFILNGKCDRLLLYSDGMAWCPIFEGGWPSFATTSPPGTTEAPTTSAPTTAVPRTTAAPTTAGPSSAAATTAAGTTAAAQTSAAPTTAAATTAAATTAAPTTAAPTTGG